VLAHLPLADGIWINTLAQLTLVCAIATVLSGAQSLRDNVRLLTPEARTARRVTAASAAA